MRLGGDLLSAQTKRVEQDLALCNGERHRVEILGSTVPRFLNCFTGFSCLPARSNLQSCMNYDLLKQCFNII